MAATVMATDTDTLMHHLRLSSLNRRMHLSAMTIMTITAMGVHMTVIHTLIIHTLTPKLRNTRIQTHTPTLIRTRRIPIHTHTHSPLPLLRPKRPLGDIFMYRPLIIVPTLNSLHALTLIPPRTPMRTAIVRIRTPMHTYTRQRQTG